MEEADSHTVSNATLRRCYSKLVELMNPVAVLDLFMEKDLLGDMTKVKVRDIRELLITTDKNRAIYDTISRDPRAYPEFKECLAKTRQIELLDVLEKKEEEVHIEMKENGHCCIYKATDICEVMASLKCDRDLTVYLPPNVREKVKHVRDIDCMTDSDAKDCHIVGSVMLPNDKLVLTDHDNNKVKLLDTRRSKIVDEVTVPSYPVGVCQITDTQVAVAAARIVVLETKPSLCVTSGFDVHGTSRGIGYTEGKLIVSFICPHKVEILDLQGTVLKRIETDDQGQSLFHYPHHVAINQSKKLVYVSNYDAHNVVCMKLDGTVMAKYTDSELQGPIQVTVDNANGMVYVCGRKSDNIHRITEDCKKVKVLADSTNGLSAPESIAYSQKYGTLYISNFNTNTKNLVKVYQLILKQ